MATDGSADYADADGDHAGNWLEWNAMTNPTNALSVLRLSSLAPSTNSLGLTMTWQSVFGMRYYVQRSTDLRDSSGFTTIRTNIFGQAGTTSITDTNANNSEPGFYRIGLGDPPLPAAQ